MNGLLAVAECFLDRMTNPQYGADVNDEYLLRFNQVLVEDQEFATEFATLSLGPEDVDSLPACAWPWYLRWRTEHAEPPAADFLDALFEATNDPAVRLAVMQSAVSERAPQARQDSDAGQEAGGQEPPYPYPGDASDREYLLGSVDHPEVPGPPPVRSRWLNTRLTRLMADPGRPGTVTSAIAMAMYLMQLGDPESVASLRALLAVRWEGQAELRQAASRQLASANLDPETEAGWRSRLGLPENPGESSPGLIQ